MCSFFQLHFPLRSNHGVWCWDQRPQEASRVVIHVAENRVLASNPYGQLIFSEQEINVACKVFGWTFVLKHNLAKLEKHILQKYFLSEKVCYCVCKTSLICTGPCNMCFAKSSERQNGTLVVRRGQSEKGSIQVLSIPPLLLTPSCLYSFWKSGFQIRSHFNNDFFFSGEKNHQRIVLNDSSCGILAYV